MVKSLFLTPPATTQLRVPAGGPLKMINPNVLFAMDALRRAWLKVKATGGGAGVDGVSLDQFEAGLEMNLANLQAEILAGSYRPQQVTRFLVPKKNGGLRPLALWSIRDKVAQRVVNDCIEPYFESQFLDCSFGFRPGRNVSHAVNEIAAQYQAHRRWVADIDIKDCFDSLNPNLTLAFVRRRVQDPLILHLIRVWLRAKVFNDLSGPNTAAGASQGAVISPLLANVYLHQVDVQLVRHQLCVTRYADDLLICCRRKRDAEQALAITGRALKKVKLQLNPHRSRVVHFDEGFKFLGVFFLKNQHFYL